jgi:hypothetical protein
MYEPDIAALQRLRRRISHDEEQSVEWKKSMLRLCDQLHRGIDDVVTQRVIASTTKETSDKKRARTSTKKRTTAARSERGDA